MLLVSARPSKRLQETAERAVCSVRGGRRWQAPAGAGAQVSEVRHAHRIASTCRALPSGTLASVSSPCPAVGPGLGVTQTVQQPVRPVVTQHLPAGAACRGAQEAAPGGLCFTACVRGWECHGAGGRHACPGARGEGPEASCCVARSPALSARRRQHAGAPRGVGGRAGGLSGGGPGGGGRGRPVDGAGEQTCLCFCVLPGSGVCSCSPWKQEFELEAPSGPGAEGQPCWPVGAGAEVARAPSQCGTESVR